MIIKFSVDGIYNMDVLYTWTKDEVFEGIEGDKENYHGAEYCKTILEDIKNKFPGMTLVYKGMTSRIANETFIVSLGEKEYILSFGIKTYNRAAARIECMIDSPNTEEYDLDLEKVKIELKNRLLKDWKVCTWLVDEQSEQLCKEAFQEAYHIENNLRAFASKVLIHFLGVNWIDSFGLNKYAESVHELKNAFVQRVPEFEDINTDFLSMTLETLVKIIFEGTVYEDKIVLNVKDYLDIQNIGTKENVKATHLADFIKKKRNVSVNIWQDCFLKYIDDEESFKNETHNFISGRNHVAHSKILSRSSYQKMKNDFLKYDNLIKKIDEKYEAEEVSQEMIATWEAEEDMHQDQAINEDYEKEYYRYRLASETGMDILDKKEIMEWFDGVLRGLYDRVYQYYNLDVCYKLSDYSSILEGHEIFSISCSAIEDGSAALHVCVNYEIDDDLGEDSICSIRCIKGTNDKLFDIDIKFHNGNGYENEDGAMEPEEISIYDDSEIDSFFNKLVDSVEKLNPYLTILHRMEYDSKGSERFVGDFPCEECNNFGVSINESFLPIGKCCYCGYMNEVERCFRCEEYVSTYLMENGYCPACAEFIENQ